MKQNYVLDSSYKHSFLHYSYCIFNKINFSDSELIIAELIFFFFLISFCIDIAYTITYHETEIGSRRENIPVVRTISFETMDNLKKNNNP